VIQQAELVPSMRGQYAGFVTRAIAFIIDLLLIVVTQVTVMLITRVVMNFFGLDELATALFEPADSNVTSPLITFARWTIAVLGGGLLFAVYVIFSWVLVGKTLGQALLGLRVTRTDGRRLSLSPAVRRLIGYYVSFLALFLGFLWIFIDERRQGWHDKLADTVVIYDWDARMGRRMRQWLADRRIA
jgi:uncharacterized RDD family membrane protein YckC